MPSNHTWQFLFAFKKQGHEQLKALEQSFKAFPETVRQAVDKANQAMQDLQATTKGVQDTLMATDLAKDKGFFAAIPPEVEGLEASAGQTDRIAKQKKQMADQQQENLRRLIDYSAVRINLEEIYHQFKIQREQLSFDQERRIHEQRLSMAGQVAQNLGSIFVDIYNLTGKKQREYFYLAKAAAFAQALINTYEGVTKALAQGGVWGTVMAGIVAAHGALAVAKITAINLANGGLVPGASPSKSADNIPARLTAGEFVHPVDVVNYYGASTMEAIRQHKIPAKFLKALAGDNLPAHWPAQNYFAEGGLATQISPTNRQNWPQVENKSSHSGTIINILDKSELLQVMASIEGETLVWNIISRNAPRIRKLLID